MTIRYPIYVASDWQLLETSRLVFVQQHQPLTSDICQPQISVRSSDLSRDFPFPAIWRNSLFPAFIWHIAHISITVTTDQTTDRQWLFVHTTNDWSAADSFEERMNRLNWKEHVIGERERSFQRERESWKKINCVCSISKKRRYDLPDLPTDLRSYLKTLPHFHPPSHRASPQSLD